MRSTRIPTSRRRLSRASSTRAGLAWSTTSSAVPFGQPIAEWAFGAVLLAGFVLAFLQRGDGYQRTMFVLLGCAALGFVAGDAAWPVLLT